MATFIVMLGPPGVGKGTQAKTLAEKTGLAHVSSGDLFREHIKNQTELGKLAKSYLDRGDLVPDDVTIGMIRERLGRVDCRVGAILDGFPRTTVQAEALETMLKDFDGQVDKVPYITAAESILVERASGRLTCRANGHIYHQKFNPPAKEGICDEDGSQLYQREDDKVETVTNRIRVYIEQTMPLVDHYRRGGRLIEIDGSQSVERVTEELLESLEQTGK